MSSGSSSIASLAQSLASPQTSTTGSSTFATDLEASVNRAIQIASLPMEELEVDQSTISGQTTELGTLGNLEKCRRTASGPGAARPGYCCPDFPARSRSL